MTTEESKAVETLRRTLPYDSDFAEARIIAIRAIQDASSAQQWIPCSERLPEEDGFYLVSCGRGILTKILWFDVDRKIPYFGRCKCGTDAVAWMTLPKPYEEKDVK